MGNTDRSLKSLKTPLEAPWAGASLPPTPPPSRRSSRAAWGWAAPASPAHKLEAAPAPRGLGRGLGVAGRGCSQNPTKILFPISGNILQTVGQGDHQFGKTGSTTTLRGPAGSSQACSATSQYWCWATGQPAPYPAPGTEPRQPSAEQSRLLQEQRNQPPRHMQNSSLPYRAGQV